MPRSLPPLTRSPSRSCSNEHTFSPWNGSSLKRAMPSSARARSSMSACVRAIAQSGNSSSWTNWRRWRSSHAARTSVALRRIGSICLARGPVNRRRLPVIARASGQLVAQEYRGRQVDRLLAYLKAHGPASDHEIAAALGIELASINSARNHLVKDQLVEAVDLVPGPRGALRTRWGLTAPRHVEEAP